MTPPHDHAYAEDSARAFARANLAMRDTVHVDSVPPSNWDDAAATFTKDGLPENAIQVVVSHGTNKMIMGILRIAAPRVKVRATAWANAPVNAATCVKQWASRHPDAPDQHRTRDNPAGLQRAGGPHVGRSRRPSRRSRVRRSSTFQVYRDNAFASPIAAIGRITVSREPALSPTGEAMN